VPQTEAAGQVVVGTDHPFDMGSDDPLGPIAAAELSDADRERIRGGNALRLLRIAG
jgi:aminocarboxymuconate-semialdehyde decarboxylase